MPPSTMPKGKRKRPVSAEDGAKRVKNGINDAPNTTTTTTTGPQVKKAGKKNKGRQQKESSTTTKPLSRAVRLDQLKWRSVPIPEMMDDYSGLYGLQEVEGVEIIRDPVTGDSTIQALEETIVQDGEKVEESDGEWNGFEEDAIMADGGEDDAQEPQVTEPTSMKEETKQKKQPTRREKKLVSKTAVETEAKSEDEDDALGSEPETADRFDVLVDEDLEMADGVDVSGWSDVPLSSFTLNALSKLGFAKPTPIQRQAIPVILGGHDVVGKAATGSGKTLAFGIPILEWYLQNRKPESATKPGKGQPQPARRPPAALIISPTRELAHQISKHLKALFEATATVGDSGPQIAVLTGGMSAQKQKRVLQTASVVVGTPGRLWDVFQQEKYMLGWMQSAQFLVIDEADRLLQNGRYLELDRILTALDKKQTTEEEFKTEETDGKPLQLEKDEGKGAKKQHKTKKPKAKASTGDPEVGAPEFKRQTLVFSATFDRSLQASLKKSRGRDFGSGDSPAESMDYLWDRLKFAESGAKVVDVNASAQMVGGLSEGVLHCDAMAKDITLYSCLMIEPSQRTIVFTNSIHAVRRVAAMLRHLELPVEALHSSMPQKARLRHLERFGTLETPENGTSTPSTAPLTPDASDVDDKSTTSATEDDDDNGEARHAEPGQMHVIKSILVTTDVAARGLDVPHTDKVIHYHVPRSADTYVHRCGRTARAGRTGKSIILCSPAETSDFQHLINRTHTNKSASTYASLQTLGIDPMVTKRVKDRITYAQKLAEADLSRTRSNTMDIWVKKAKQELGIEDGDSDFDDYQHATGSSTSSKAGKGKEWRVRGGQKKLENEQMSKDTDKIRSWAGALKELLKGRINAGISVKFASLETMRRAENSVFVGEVEPLGWKAATAPAAATTTTEETEA